MSTCRAHLISDEPRRPHPGTSAGKGGTRSRAHQDALGQLYEGTEELGRVRNLYGLLDVLHDVLPKDAVMYLEGSHRGMAPGLVNFLRDNPAAITRVIPLGTTWPESAKFHVSTTTHNLERIREIAETLAEPEVCDHLVVYRGIETLVIAYDAWDTQLHASSALPADALQRLRALVE